MKLSKLSLIFSVALLLMVAINGAISLVVLGAFDRAQAVQDERVEALRLVGELRHEMDILARLVRSYVVTRERRYLTYYHAILAIREGEKPAIANGSAVRYWDRVIAGETEFEPPLEGARVSMRSRMVRLGFQGAELAALEEVLAEADALKQIEQVAFAATQGLYDPATRALVSDGQPHPDLAVKLVHGRDYDLQHARVAVAVARLMEQVDQRTGREVDEARQHLRNWIIAVIVAMASAALLVLFGLRTTRSKVLLPLEDMSSATGRLARGQYDVRVTGEGGVEEVRVLREAFNSMATAIERDIHEREDIESALKEAGTRAELATQAKSMFLANMSHEIRTPLNAVIGMAEVILHSPLLPWQRDYAEKIRMAGRSLLDTVNDILDFSKIEAGRLELESVPFRLEEVVANAYLLVERTALEKGVELLFEARRGSGSLLSETLVGDPLRIGQVLGNLLSNAVKFTPAGHVSLRVDGQPAEDGRLMLSLIVEDTGIGMRPDQIERLFEDFVQADGATTRQYGGTGLGLAIVRRLVNLMGGDIRVQSVPKRGSVFQVLLPLAWAGAGGEAGVDEACRALRVLVADDYPEARLALIDLLNFAGIDNVDAVSGGAEVLACLEAARNDGLPYDLLFLDGSLPDRDGGEILDRLREQPDLSPRHVALMSMPRAIEGETPEIHPDGLYFCDKPVLPGALRRLCDAVLGRVVASSGSSGVVTGALDGMRVLLVEDNATGRDVAIALMGRWGVEVDTAGDGRDALGQLAAQPPDYYALVFMDLQMPVMDGYEAVRQLRAQPAYAGLPIYALSAHSGRAVLERCLAIGMNGCINKPYELSDLYKVLRQHYPGAPDLADLPMAAASSAVLTGLNDIPGLDARCAVNDTGISPTLYPRLLTKFRLQFADGPVELKAAVEDRAWDQVAYCAHTLKGRAGLLGMNEVSALAGRLETAAHAGDNSRARLLLKSLEEHLQVIVSGLARILPAGTLTDEAASDASLASESRA
ncbi:response regulator [Zoogloea sp.]|uniref:response regulator n=1 Tax=Zoogloea sp. TaxID=49181 RepID=UPI001AD3BE1B|nr:response regulator [Zoogloea sp.]MBN8283335.1 response regulator [Zoogloea sp.]